MCKECRERREAMIEDALQGRLLSAAGHAITGAAEMVGLKAKGDKKPARKLSKPED